MEVAETAWFKDRKTKRDVSIVIGRRNLTDFSSKRSDNALILTGNIVSKNTIARGPYQQDERSVEESPNVHMRKLRQRKAT